MRQIDERWLQCRASRNGQAKTKIALRVSPLFVESVQEVGFVIVALKTLSGSISSK